MKLLLVEDEAKIASFVKKGLDAGRFEIEGAGKSRPLIPKKGPGFDEKNRRTEFKIIDD